MHHVTMTTAALSHNLDAPFLLLPYWYMNTPCTFWMRTIALGIVNAISTYAAKDDVEGNTAEEPWARGLLIYE